MHIDLDSYERTLREQWQQNEKDLAAFASSLEADGMPDRTIRHHLRNVGCFLNEYLLHEDDNSTEMGCYLVDDYMETYVIQQCSWATPRAIEHNGASLVRFYRFMRDTHHVDEDAFDELQATIDAQLPLWKDECRKIGGASAESGSDAGHGGGLLASIHEAVSNSIGGVRGAASAASTAGEVSPKAGEVAPEVGESNTPAMREEAVDALTLALIRLASAEDTTGGYTCDDAIGAALGRLRAWGLVSEDAGGLSTLTPQGVTLADATLARLGFEGLA
ncbi:MAG: hypothetical protein IKG18_04340 [Atopobiaceae bacterium]|nr:hypothetical protein [Atopobiaceae bacterium]